MMHEIIPGIDDNTQPFARMGRKAYGSYRDSRVAEISYDVRSRLFCFLHLHRLGRARKRRSLSDRRIMPARGARIGI